MGRLDPALVERVDAYGDRALDVADVLDSQKRSRRAIDQMYGCGTSFGANASEADETVSRKDFCKLLGIMLKELNETRYWLRLAARRGWVAADRLTGLQSEVGELKLIFGAILTRTQRNGT